MRITRYELCGGLVLGTALMFLVSGCRNTSIDLEQAASPAPLRIPPPNVSACTYEDSLTGGQVFTMYCAGCHNARSLAERPFSNYQNVAAHMRVRANLTGKEYAKLVEWMARWSDVPSPNRPSDPSPKRLIFSQPIPELREELPAPRGIPDMPAPAARETP